MGIFTSDFIGYFLGGKNNITLFYRTKNILDPFIVNYR